MKQLSYGQRGMWVLHQLDPTSPAYNLAIAFEVSGKLDSSRLERALQAIVQRHETLRSKVVETSEGPAAVVEAPFPLKIEVIPGSENPLERAVEFLSRPFDLTIVPGLRVGLVEAEPTLLVVCVHHIWSDDVSLQILAEDLAASYNEIRIDVGEEPRVSFSQLVEAERSRLSGQNLAAASAYWRRTLRNVTDAVVPVYDWPSRRSPFGPARRLEAGLSDGVVSKANAVAKSLQADVFEVFVAAYAALAAEYAEADEIVVGLVVENRSDPATEETSGLLVNTVPLRCSLSGIESFSDLVASVHEGRKEALRHALIPFEKLIEEVGPGRRADANPFFNVLVSVEDSEPLKLRFGDAEALQLELPPAGARLDLEAVLIMRGEAACIRIDYNSDVYSDSSIRAFSSRLRKFIEWSTANPQDAFQGAIFQLIGETPMHPEQVTAFNAIDTPVYELIERRVRDQPQHQAVVSSDGVVTYAELWKMSDRVAASLLAMGCRPETPVALWASRDVATVAAMIGVLRAGGAFVPIDPDLPSARKELILSQLQEPILVGDWAPGPGRRLQIADGSPADVEIAPGQAAYVIFTSGTTGTPKGAIVPHSALSTFSHEIAELFELTAEDRVLQFASLSFDASIEEIFPTLIAGATLVLRDRELWGPEELRERSNELGLTVLDLPTAYWHEIVRVQRHSKQKVLGEDVRLVIIGGEAASPAAAETWISSPSHDVALLNTYGPTETTVTATFEKLDRALPRVPIGRPLNGVRALVLDRHLNAIPAGVVGDLYIGGFGLARGYISLPDQTADRFIPDPFAGDGSRIYRTGDRARYNFDGKLEFFGRSDDQVKLRGFRIELSDISSALMDHPAVDDAAALLIEHESTPLICAWFAPDTAPRDSELRTFLESRLPAYMIPSAFVRMEALPRTTSRKLDRKLLPLPELRRAASTVPRTPTEELVAAVWQSILGGEVPSSTDDFFALGGHSLLATQVMSRLRKDFSVDLPLRTIFEHPTVSELASALDRAIHEGTALEEVPMRKEGGRGPFRLSLEQERLWFFDRFEPGSGDYVIPMSARLKGDLDLNVLSLAIEDLVQANRAFRTYFSTEGGIPMQSVDDEARITIETVDARKLPPEETKLFLEEAKRLESRTPFQLSKAPLLRAKVIRLAEDETALLLSMHHIVSDGWSVGVIAEQLNTFYRARIAGEVPSMEETGLEYADFASWQREWVESEQAAAELEYWKSHLSGESTLHELPADRPRPRVKTFSGALHSLRISADLASRLSDRARDNSATLFMVLLAAFKVLIHRYTGETSVRVGTPIAGRNHRDLESIVGFFVNTLVMQTEIPDEADFDSVIARVRESAIGAYAHQDLPFEKVVQELQPERDPSRSPLTQLMFVMHNTPKPALNLPRCQPALLDAPTNAVPVDMTLEVDEHQGELQLTFLYNTDLFDAATVERFANHYVRVLEAAAAQVDSLARVDLLTPEERFLITREWNQTATPYPKDATVHGLFQEVAGQTPQAIALEWEQSTMSYAELDARSSSIAAKLMTRVVPGEPVAILLERSPQLIVAMLAVLKSGAPYVPLDLEYPPQRLEFMLSDAEARIVITDRRQIHRVKSLGNIDVIDVEASFEDAPPPSTQAGPMSPAYVMYTSGSTGTPKGIVIPHRAIVRLVRSTNYVDIKPDDVVAQASNASFDAATFEIWGALLNGARLCGVRRETMLSPKALKREVTERGITKLIVTTALFNQIAAEEPRCFESARDVLFGGEVADPKKAAAIAQSSPPRRLVHVYGPTESTTFATSYTLPNNFQEDDPLPIGRPISNTTVYILDRHMNPVPVGVPGEIHIGGDGLALEYLNRPSLTKEKFIESEFGRLYKTGDFGKFNILGEVEFLGRMDEQLKIRGFRVEPAEIENAIHSHSGVAQVVVTVQRKRDQVSLVAYFVPSGEAGPDVTELRSHIASVLPQYMVPRYFVSLDSIPLTPNGKVDKQRLPEPESLSSGDQYIPPSNEIERELAEVWQEILELPRVGVDQSFFELGGHSLIATQMVARITDRLGVELPLKVVFEEATINHLAKVVEAAIARGERKPAPIPRLSRGRGPG